MGGRDMCEEDNRSGISPIEWEKRWGNEKHNPKLEAQQLARVVRENDKMSDFEHGEGVKHLMRVFMDR